MTKNPEPPSLNQEPKTIINPTNYIRVLCLLLVSLIIDAHQWLTILLITQETLQLLSSAGHRVES